MIVRTILAALAFGIVATAAPAQTLDLSPEQPGRPRAERDEAARDGKTKLVGTFSGGWPLVAEIAVTTRKGGGLADAITQAINTQIRNGNYAKALARWNLAPEAIERSQTNPPGLPKS